MFQKITLILLLLIILSCNNSGSKEYPKIEMADWLIGTWINDNSEGTFTESWKKANDSTFYGQSYFIKGKDTLHFEKIKLQQTGDNLTYDTTIKGQNNDKPMSYSFTETTEKELVFENAKYDYPQKISYKQVSNDSLVAEISGLQLGKPSSEKYLMRKKK